MLEDRLSNTYSQHSIGGYNLPQQQQNVYPSIPTNLPNGLGGAESFYTGNAAPQIEQRGSYDQYGRVPPYGQPIPQQFSGYGQAPPPPQHTYPNLEQRQENHTPYQPQRTSSYSQQPQAHQSHHVPLQPQQSFNSSEPAMTTSADANTAFYHGNGPQQQQHPQQYQQERIPSAPPGPSDHAQNYYAQSQAGSEQNQNPHANLQSPQPVGADQSHYIVSPMQQPAPIDRSRYQNMQSPQPSQHSVSQAHSPEVSNRHPAQQAPGQPQAGYQYWQQQQQHNLQQYSPQEQIGRAHV